MIRVLLAIACLSALGSAAASGAARIAVGDDGRPVLTMPGRPDVRGHLFTHYDGWIWSGAGALAHRSDGAWTGAVAKAPGDGDGRIEFTQAARILPDGLRLSYRFRRTGAIELRSGVFLALSFPNATYAGRDVIFTQGPPARTGATFDVPARGCTVNLSEDAALRIDCDRITRFTTWVDQGRGFDLNVRLVPSDFGREADARVTLRIVPPVEAVDSWQAPPDSRPLRIGAVRPGRRVVRRGEPIEFSVDLSASYRNPFDPRQIALDAFVRTPKGDTECVPGFYWQGFDAENGGGEEALTRSGAAGWRVRYTPREAGDYSVTVRAKDASGEQMAAPVEFGCTESDAPGFVHVGPAHGDGPRYLAFDNGHTFFAIGHNVTSYPADLEDVFRRMAAGGENYTRFWMWSSALGLEWAQPLGFYRMDEAWRLDRVLDRAREYGIYVMLCLDTHQDFSDRWADNPYNAARGGPCGQVMDFFRSEAARAAYKNRLRYVIARWGHHPNLLCWELVNEVEGFDDSSRHKDDVVRWHAEMARFIEDLDAYDHPITTSQWTTEGWPELWSLPEMDIVQSHRYANDPEADMAGDVAAICAQKLRDYPGKPHLFGEYGVDSKGGAADTDPGGVHLHNGNWAALMSGAASNPVSWWHAEYIQPLRLYGVYRGLARFVDGEPLACRRWRPVAVDSIDFIQAPEIERRDLEFVGGQTGWDRPVPQGTRFVLGRDGTVAGREELPRVLHGEAHADLRSPFTFDLDCLAPTRFAVRVGTVSQGAVLEFHLDGQLVRTVELPAGEGLARGSEWQPRWGIWQTKYDESFDIPVPAGRHTVEIENTGKDWLEVLGVRVEDYVTNERPRLRVLGLASDARALLWAQNTEHTWFNVRDGRRIEAVAPTRVLLSGLTDGTYTVQWWDTRAGRAVGTSLATVRAGRLTLELPQLARDLAVKLVRRGGR